MNNALAEDYVGNGQAIITDGNWDSVYGLKGQPRAGDEVAEKATISISGGSVEKYIYGGYTNNTNGAALSGSNSVTITGLSSNGAYLTMYGGYARSDTGYASAAANSLSISGTPIQGNAPQAFGGYATSRGATGGHLLATNNRVYINLESSASPDAALDMVAGGWSRAESSTGTTAGSLGNSVTVTSGRVSILYGGVSKASAEAEASQNTLVISGGAVNSATAGEAYSTSQTAVADGNTVSVTGGTHGNILAASAQSDTELASASDNAVYISHATVTGGVTGGLSTNTNSPVSLNNNSVVIGAGAVVGSNVHGGDANQQISADGNSACRNTIAVVGGGQVGGDLVGGDLGSNTGDASQNVILVDNGSVGSDIIGGRTAAGGSTTNNSIIIGQQACLATTSNLFGGEVGGQAVAARGSGNTLFVDSWQGTVNRAAGFANLHFVLPAPGSVDDSIPMLTVSNAQPGDFDGTTVTAQLPSTITGGSAHIGKTFELVHDSSGAIAMADVGGLVSLEQGYATLYDGVIFKDEDSVYIRIDGARVNPLAGALTEARVGAASLLNQGGDLLAGAARYAADTAARATKGWAVFATAYGGASDLSTEGDISVNGMSLVTGITRREQRAWSDMLVGAFFETGTANLDTKRSVISRTISGSGDADYAGGGLFAHLGIERGTLRGLYFEASGRVGEASTSWHSADLLNNLNLPAAYDISTPYYGGHIGIGYVVQFNDTWALDISSKYLFLHQAGCHTTINGETFRFDSVDSGRLRSGARLFGKVLPKAAVYLGAAWEREFQGKACATSQSNAMSIPSTSMDGSSAIFELGMAVHPESVPILLDVAIEGSAGTRRSIGGRVQLMFEF